MVIVELLLDRLDWRSRHAVCFIIRPPRSILEPIPELEVASQNVVLVFDMGGGDRLACYRLDGGQYPLLNLWFYRGRQPCVRLY